MIIIWNRWGILVIPLVALGVGIAYLIKAFLGIDVNTGAHAWLFIGLGFVFGAGLVWLAVYYLVGKVIDKPKPVFGQVPLEQPVTHPNGQVQTHQVVPLVNPATGEQAVRHPVSSLFFVPVKYWPIVLAAGGALIFVVSLCIVLAGGR